MRSQPAFDHAGLARALSQVPGEYGSGKGLPASLTNAQLSDDLTHLTGHVDKKSVDCNLKTLQCRAFDTPAAAPELLPSPDGHWVALTRDDNLFVREVATGHERQLTTDGAPFYSWARLPDNSFTTVVRQKSGVKAALYETYWSPDGRYLIAPRIDERKVAVYPFVEGVPTDGSQRPIIHDVRLTFNGDRDRIRMDYFLFDLKTGRRLAVELPEDYEQRWADPRMSIRECSAGAVLAARHFSWQRRWDRSRSLFFALDLATGSVSKVFEEASSTRVETNTLASSWRIFACSATALSSSGTPIAAVGDISICTMHRPADSRMRSRAAIGWCVDIQAVDEVHREIYFTAVGREARTRSVLPPPVPHQS